MRLLITNKKDDQEFVKEFDTFTDCKHWITNHLDLSKGWQVQDITPASKVLAKTKRVYKIRGSHRDERKIKGLLGFDPDIHSGMAGKGAFCAKLTDAEKQLLIDNGFKVNKKPVR